MTQIRLLHLQMTSVERVVEYCNLESEASSETDTKPPKTWPPKGQIRMDDMSFSYHRSLPRVLHHITYCIKPMEKVKCEMQQQMFFGSCTFMV